MTDEELRIVELKKIENNVRENKNIEIIAGIDEAGRGPLAGPVVVATCIMPKDSKIERINDSKKLSEKRRDELYENIINESISYSIGIVESDEIDNINILEATKKALTKSIEGLDVKPEYILIDALDGVDTLGIPYESIKKGDLNVYSIACASILAKVTRDRMMKEYGEKYPGYGFEKHKGYGTKAHYEALKDKGLSPIHRKSFVHLDKDGNRIKAKRQ